MPAGVMNMSSSKGSILTVEDQEEILSLHAQGLSNKEIVKITGKSYPTVCRITKRGCVKQSKIANWTQEEIDMLCALAHKGFSNKEIAKRIGRTEWAVRTKRLDKSIWRQGPSVGEETWRTWSTLLNNIQNKLKCGSKYVVRFLGKGPAEAERRWLRPLIFEGIQHNWLGRPIYIFRSEAGFRETFTPQQLLDVVFDKIEEVAVR